MLNNYSFLEIYTWNMFYILRSFANILQREAGSDRFVLSIRALFEYATSFKYTLDLSHSIYVLIKAQTEYALNAVNQGVTALGIKGI